MVAKGVGMRIVVAKEVDVRLVVAKKVGVYYFLAITCVKIIEERTQ